MQPAGWLFSRRTVGIRLFPIGVHRRPSALLALEPIYAVARAEVHASTEMFKKKERQAPVVREGLVLFPVPPFDQLEGGAVFCYYFQGV